MTGVFYWIGAVMIVVGIAIPALWNWFFGGGDDSDDSDDSDKKDS